MSEEIVVAIMSAGAVIIAAAVGVAGALLGGHRHRLPPQLRKAKYLATALDAMTKGSAEEALARSVHDDLVVDWALTEADHSYDEVVTAARPLTISGALIVIAGFAGVAGSAAATTVLRAGGGSQTTLPEWLLATTEVAAYVFWAGVLILFVGAVLYLLGRGWHDRNVEAIRSAHNLRISVKTMNDIAMKVHRTEGRKILIAKIKKPFRKMIKRTRRST